MQVGFDNISEHIISIDDFSLKWRFTDENYDKLPDIHLEQLKPLDKEASLFLWNYISKAGLYDDVPFKKNLFRTIDHLPNVLDNEKDTKKWLYKSGPAPEERIFLSYQRDMAMIVPWKLLVEYFDSFYYPVSDDLTVFDQSLNWALLFFHEDEIYFGANEKFSNYVQQ
ncbi:MAG TPA: hypothetical protein VGI43_11110 [Mucilaginibacter sp.]|jgi:hypothetical protein